MLSSLKQVLRIVIILFFVPLVLSAVDLNNSKLPIVYINTGGQTIVDEPKIDATMTIYWSPDEINSPAAASVHYDGAIGIERRGNSSQSWPKKPYKLETRNADGSNLNFALMGLPQENDWVFHAPYVDKTLLRNALIYRLLDEMGWYAPHYKFCELVINDDYKGVYVLVESLKIDDNRLDITRTSANDITGGYFLELTTSNRLASGEPYLTTDIAEQVMAIKYPKEEDLTEAHEQYITTYINDFEKALKNKYYSGSKDYKNYIDVPSFIDHMLVSEVFRQLDVFCASHHFYKDANGKLMMGPGWDYNRSIGNYKGYDTWKTNGFWLTSSRGGCKPFWPEYIYDDEVFMAAYKARYRELRKGVLNAGHIYAIIDEYSQYLDDAQDRNFSIWDIDENRAHKYVQGSYEGEIDYVKDWLKDRLIWLDEQWGATPHPVINEFYADGEGLGTQWVELYNPSVSSIDISGWIFKVSDQAYTFPANTTIAAQEYLILTADKGLFQSKHSQVSNVYEGLKGNLYTDDMTMQLLQDSTVLDEINTSVSKGWPVISKSGNYAVGKRVIAFDNTDGIYWNWSIAEGGTPGRMNKIYSYEGLVISELMSQNVHTIVDDYNENDDWVEMTNTTNYTLNLMGLFLSDRLEDKGKWQLTDSLNRKNAIVAPGQSILLWLDSDADTQGNLHANFGLQALGESIALSYFDGYNYKLIHHVNMPAMGVDQSYQLSDLSGDDWVLSDTPTPTNDATGLMVSTPKEFFQLEIYPNPVREQFSIDFNLPSIQQVNADVVDVSGRCIMNLLQDVNLSAGHYNYIFSLPKDLPEGMYILNMRGDDFRETKKLLYVGN